MPRNRNPWSKGCIEHGCKRNNMNWYKQSQKPKIISMDFDGTLTLPEWDGENEIWVDSNNPNWKNINLLKRLAEKVG